MDGLRSGLRRGRLPPGCSTRPVTRPPGSLDSSDASDFVSTLNTSCWGHRWRGKGFIVRTASLVGRTPLVKPSAPLKPVIRTDHMLFQSGKSVTDRNGLSVNSPLPRRVSRYLPKDIMCPCVNIHFSMFILVESFVNML